MTLTPGTVLELTLPAASLTWIVMGRCGPDLGQIELRSPFKAHVERVAYVDVQRWIVGGRVQVRKGAV